MSDIIIQNGVFFDWRGAPGAPRHLRISGGVLVAVSDQPLTPADGDTVIDASGKWVMPGFIDLHTHYDAEIELNPSLHESLRHGVTTVFLGSCSLSTAIGDPVDIADMFTRVEGIQYQHLAPLMRRKKTWNTHAEYVAHLESLPLGPNVASFVGYSAVRSHVLGLQRALDPKVEPTEEEMVKMEAIVEEGYDAGFLGLSFNTLYLGQDGRRPLSVEVPAVDLRQLVRDPSYGPRDPTPWLELTGRAEHLDQVRAVHLRRLQPGAVLPSVAQDVTHLDHGPAE